MASILSAPLRNAVRQPLLHPGLLGLLMLALLLQACGKGDDAAAQAHGPGAMPVTMLTVTPSSMPISAEVVAQTEGAKEVEIRARVGGILLKRLYEEGATVKAGQALFQIDPEPYRIALTQARAQLAAQQARVDQTTREEARLKGLLETQAVSQREYDNASSDHALAKATLQQMQASVREAELNLSYTLVTAPVGGVSGRFQFSEGALIAANTSLLTTVVQVSPIWVRFSFSDNELAKLGGRLNNNNVREVTLTLPDGSAYAQTGKLNFAASQIDPVLGTQQLRATFDNTDQKLLPGQFVRARVTTGQRDGVFLVPQVAVQTGDQGKFVYVVNEAGEATPRPVVVGDWVGKEWAILDGLKEGEQVIVDNLIKIRPGAKVMDVSKMPPPAAQPAGDQPAAQH